MVSYSLPRSPSAGLDAAVSASYVSAEATSAATQPTAALYNEDSARMEPSLIPLSLLSHSSAVVEPCSSLATNPSLPALLIVFPSEFPAEVVPAAQQLPPAMSLIKGSTTQIFREGLVRQEEKISRLNMPNIDREVHLESLQSE